VQLRVAERAGKLIPGEQHDARVGRCLGCFCRRCRCAVSFEHPPPTTFSLPCNFREHSAFSNWNHGFRVVKYIQRRFAEAMMRGIELEQDRKPSMLQ
jgi:hypothetical protein